jgi:hypothetical protein
MIFCGCGVPGRSMLHALDTPHVIECIVVVEVVMLFKKTNKEWPRGIK